MADDVPEGKLFATFERHGEFLNAQQLLLSLDLYEEPSLDADKKEFFLSQRLFVILAEYQEQSYLLDPFLEQLIAPVVELLKFYAKKSIQNPDEKGSSARVERVASLLYNYIKCRGYKTIIRFFPHEIADLSIALDFMLLPNGLAQDGSQWALRYVVLLWLSLICMLPFDLVQFDEADQKGRTASLIESVAKSQLGKAGLERVGAALLLSRLFMRKDTGSGFNGFLTWSLDSVKDTDPITSIGILQVLCEIVKSGPQEQIQTEVSQLLAVAHMIDQSPTLNSNTVVRKFKTKLVSRVALRILPNRQSASRRTGRTLTGDYIAGAAIEDDFDVPEEVESVLEQLFTTLQDKDTIVRWSAAKGVASIAERLPTDFANQVFETVMSLFAIHSIAAASLYDLPAIAESTWHGAALACAEMARRNLVSTESLPVLIEWLSKALYFDLRKGAHSIGSNVRDAASYVLWALARTQNPLALIPHADTLARKLVAVALYDREIHIRRAASAAFQEHVGRTGLFPHGIDVLGKTDFYAVSIRKNAFLVAAPQVAEHAEYQQFLLDHVVDVVLRHWDIAMRELGSQSLRHICLLDPDSLVPKATFKIERLLQSLDSTDVHGGLLGLNEIAMGFLEITINHDLLEDRLRNIFKYINVVSEDVLMKPRNELVTAATCRLIASTITLTEIRLEQQSTVSNWRTIVDFSLKHRSKSVQEAGADAIAAVSKLVDCSSVISRLIQELQTGSPVNQESLARLLGVIDYNSHPASLKQAINWLLESVKPSARPNIEARRLSFVSIPRILSTILPQLNSFLTSVEVNALFNALVEGLNDYTLDERGDVGSWVRLVCVQGLSSFSSIMITNANSIGDFCEYFPANKYHIAIAGILKQGVERLDNVRQEAGVCFMHLLDLPDPEVSQGHLWRLPGQPILREIFPKEEEPPQWNDGTWLFPRAVRLLEIPEYRTAVITGLLLSLNSKTDSTQRPLATSLVKYVRQLPTTADRSNAYTVVTFVDNMIYHAKSRITSNAVVIPVFQAFNVLFEGDALRQLEDEPSGMKSLGELLSISSRGVARLKNVQRIHEAMKIVINLLSFGGLFKACIPQISNFLAHPFPRIRADTAEYLYLVLQGVDIGIETDDIESVLLETEWSSIDDETAKQASQQVTQLFISSS
ncbi:TBCD protein [Crucibulum laeve]|uniref:TBCD protein n=1 Tax=Crucibulum laeve TaxID=68775 RepID=A0A5C3M9P1_9AGAR|nr:TBCD protein [Crucibulum laeve]